MAGNSTMKLNELKIIFPYSFMSGHVTDPKRKSTVGQAEDPSGETHAVAQPSHE